VNTARRGADLGPASGWWGRRRLDVRDDGPGIPEDEQPHLFERFFVGRNDRRRHRPRRRPGLPTALAIAQAHGGRIDVVSSPDRGSLFSLVVPADGPHEGD